MLKESIEALARCAAKSVESLSGAVCESAEAGKEISSSDIMAPDRAIQWTAGLGPQGEIRLHLCCSIENSEKIGKFILEAAGLDEFDAATLKSTYFEVLAQAASAWSQELTRILEKKIEIEESGETVSFPAQLRFFPLRLRFAEQEFAAYLGVPATAFQKLIPPPVLEPIPSPGTALLSAKNPSAFELLLDVELPVSISFGRALVPLKEILRLSSGSIVELDRAVTEPVEVIVNNCVIARGEVVVVEGNYGVRIQQIVSRQDRLKSVK